MAKKLFDIYSILGILVSILAVAVNYFVPGDIPTIYFLIGLGIFSGLLAFIIQISFVLSKFSDVEYKLTSLRDKFRKLDLEVSSLKQTFKTSEELNKLRLDIKELQAKLIK